MEDIREKRFTLKIAADRGLLGSEAARDVREALQKRLRERESINMVFAAAPSQQEFLDCFASDKEIDFTRINAFHMDEYIGLPEGAPQSFGHFLRERLFSRVPFKNAYYMDALTRDPESECRRYAELLQAFPPDIVCLGVGENGHIAFNDPGVADFQDEKTVKVVKLDEACRQQQVNDGCFPRLEAVPTHAITLTVPVLASAPLHFCMVPGEKKAAAVRKMLLGPVSEECPASILRLCPRATLYLDGDSGAGL